MANGNILSQMREMAERHEIDPAMGLPIIFQALVDLLEGQNNITKENHDYRKNREAEILAYREKREREEGIYREQNEEKHRACDERLQALETRKDIRIAVIGASGVGVGALITALGAWLVASLS